MAEQKFDIDYFAHLARLRFNAKEKKKLEDDLNKILSMINHLSKLDLEQIELAPQSTLKSSVYRKDKAQKTANLDSILSTMIEVDENSLKVPRIIEE